MQNRIYHESQQGQLCAQHALNNLLQGNYFSAIDLSEIAQDLDAAERAVQEGRFSVSQNYDDSGFFSIQVIQKSLEVWNLQLVPISSQEAHEAKKSPFAQKAFILNLNEHWITLRKFGKFWFNLDSCKTPTFIGDTYLEVLINQLQNDGYSVFNVKGDLPMSDADFYCIENPDETPNSKEKFPGSGYKLSAPQSSSDEDLAQAIQMSLETGSNSSLDSEMEKAILESLKNVDPNEEIRRKRLAAFNKKSF